MTATAMASDLSERIRHEGVEQLRKLDAMTHPGRVQALAKAKRRRRMSVWTLLFVGIGVAYTLYRAMRDTHEEPFVKTPDVRDTKDIAAA